MEVKQIKFAEGEQYQVTFKYDTPKTGMNQHGEWNLYGVEHNGIDSSFFASPGLHNRVRNFRQGDTISITKNMANGRVSWDVKKVNSSSSANGVVSLDTRTKDIHRQVCLKLAVESIGAKAKVTDGYFKDVKERMNGFLAVLDPVEAIKDKFDGEEIGEGEKVPF
jgi:hypothetical protein|tara:strand:- start:1505 stop:1999 length:495 start_codon:yes stop_codon:yes gene_type:complete